MPGTMWNKRKRTNVESEKVDCEGVARAARNGRDRCTECPGRLGVGEEAVEDLMNEAVPRHDHNGVVSVKW